MLNTIELASAWIQDPAR